VRLSSWNLLWRVLKIVRAYYGGGGVAIQALEGPENRTPNRRLQVCDPNGEGGGCTLAGSVVLDSPLSSAPGAPPDNAAAAAGAPPACASMMKKGGTGTVLRNLFQKGTQCHATEKACTSTSSDFGRASPLPTQSPPGSPGACPAEKKQPCVPIDRHYLKLEPRAAFPAKAPLSSSPHLREPPALSFPHCQCTGLSKN
jgi:hypothetical protein